MAQRLIHALSVSISSSKLCRFRSGLFWPMPDNGALQDLLYVWRHISPQFRSIHYVISMFSPLAPIACSLWFGFFFLVNVILLLCENFINDSYFCRSFSAFQWNCFSISFIVFDITEKNRWQFMSVDSCMSKTHDRLDRTAKDMLHLIVKFHEIKQFS